MSAIVAQSALVLDLRRGTTAILNDAGDQVGSSEVLRPRAVVLRERDAKAVALTVHPAEVNPDMPRFLRGKVWHPVSDPVGERVGFVTKAGAFSVDRRKLLNAGGWWSSGVSWRLRQEDMEVARAERLAREQGRKSTVGSRFRSERLRIAIAPELGDVEMRRLALAALVIAFLARGDNGY